MNESYGKLKILTVLFLLAFAVYTYNTLPSVLSWGPNANYSNISVRTTVHVTSSIPEIMSITCNDGTPVLLVPGGAQNVSCDIVIRDFNGGESLIGANDSGVNTTTLYYIANLSDDTDDNNTHYTNISCTTDGTGWGNLSEFINWTCGFSVLYYANNGTWNVNVSVHDRYNGSNYNVSSTSTTSIEALYALNVTNLIDFGDMFVGETTQDPGVQANITNFGNMDINVSLYGYGAEDYASYSNYAMICTVRNISLSDERYSFSDVETFITMSSITNSPVLLPDLTLPQQTNDSQQVINATYWKLYVNATVNPYGQCNGTVVFTVIPSS